ncbi:MAG: sulfatase-like hydrolase/transferase, partial [Acidobacteriota bacterium]
MWFLWVHLFDPHDPYDPPEPFKTDHENKLYDGEVAYVDHSLGTLFEYMERGDLFRRTFVVLTGDHGESPIPEYYDLKKDYNETKNLL